MDAVMDSDTGKRGLRPPAALVMDDMDDHDVAALRSRLKSLELLVDRAGGGSIVGDQAGRSWRFDLADGTRMTLSVSRTLTSLDVSPLTGTMPFGLWMEIQNDDPPSSSGTTELRDVVRAWRRWLRLPRRMRRTSLEKPSEQHVRVAAITSALLMIHGDRGPGSVLETFGDLFLHIRPPSVGTDASIRDDWSKKEVLTKDLTAHLLRDLPVEACLSYDSKQRRYMVGDVEAEPNVRVGWPDALEAMRLVADLPAAFHVATSIAPRFRA
jgi:hypothetical protein